MASNIWGALILTGGKSNRMKENKAFMTLGGKPLILHVIDKVAGLTCEIIVVSGKNDDLKRYTNILPSTVTLLKDSIEDKGPLAGMLTGMKSMRSKYALVLPCDTPFIESKVIAHLMKLTQKSDVVIPRWPNGNIEPLFAFYNISSTLPIIQNALCKGELFVLYMVKQIDKLVYVDVDEIKKLDTKLTTFFNINSREDLKAAEILLSNTRK
jgi:molybdopterin-guanine dinucleotide biosynthesis protein A